MASQEKTTEQGDSRAEAAGKGFEIRCGLTLAVFAAVLAVTELFSGKFGDDEIKAINEKASAYMWYQSKSIKETILEGQHELLKAMIDARAIQATHLAAIENQVKSLDAQIDRYGREKKEILLGSAAVGKDNWIQEVKGELGKVIGAEELGRDADRLGAIGDRLDVSTLFLQLCLVLGAVAIVVQSRRLQKSFYWSMVILGTFGSVISITTLSVAPS